VRLLIDLGPKVLSSSERAQNFLQNGPCFKIKKHRLQGVRAADCRRNPIFGQFSHFSDVIFSFILHGNFFLRLLEKLPYFVSFPTMCVSWVIRYFIEEILTTKLNKTTQKTRKFHEKKIKKKKKKSLIASKPTLPLKIINRQHV
jgi:hypothetical protein